MVLLDDLKGVESGLGPQVGDDRGLRYARQRQSPRLALLEIRIQPANVAEKCFVQGGSNELGQLLDVLLLGGKFGRREDSYATLLLGASVNRLGGGIIGLTPKESFFRLAFSLIYLQFTSGIERQVQENV